MSFEDDVYDLVGVNAADREEANRRVENSKRAKAQKAANKPRTKALNSALDMGRQASRSVMTGQAVEEADREARAERPRAPRERRGGGFSEAPKGGDDFEF